MGCICFKAGAVDDDDVPLINFMDVNINLHTGGNFQLSNISDEQLDRAYYKYAKLVHPDRNRDNIESATDEFKKLRRAYEMLKTESSRHKLDAMCAEYLKNSVKVAQSDDVQTEFERYFIRLVVASAHM